MIVFVPERPIYEKKINDEFLRSEFDSIQIYSLLSIIPYPTRNQQRCR
jgi:hypothetical protein